MRTLCCLNWLGFLTFLEYICDFYIAKVGFALCMQALWDAHFTKFLAAGSHTRMQ